MRIIRYAQVFCRKKLLSSGSVHNEYRAQSVRYLVYPLYHNCISIHQQQKSDFIARSFHEKKGRKRREKIHK